jgi:hypothetical protein
MAALIPETVNLEGRRILLISPRFFGYERRIAEQLESRGAKVTFVDDRPSNSTLSKFLIRLSSALIQPRLDAYHRSEIQRLKGVSFDDILFIEPESCSAKTIRNYKAAFPNAKFILYMWDSFDNKASHLKGSLSLFDRTFSFDNLDCNLHRMIFRPLFFMPSSCSKEGGVSHTFGFSFVGTIHSDRYKIIKTLLVQAETSGLNTFFYPFLPSKLIFWFYRIIKREFRDTHLRDFNFRSLPYSEVLRVFTSSIAVVDIEHPGQRGLTMRTLEVIGASKKLITTNERIIQYPFYSPDRILIIDRKIPTLDVNFLKVPAHPLSPDIMAKYSIDGWIDDLFGESVLENCHKEGPPENSDRMVRARPS